VTSAGQAGNWESVPTMSCHECGADAPAGAFCGKCGATTSPQRRGGPAWLRIGAYAAAPNERVARPWVSSSLFPHLPRSSRSAFRLGLIVLVVLLVVFALLRWQPPMIGISTLGLPLLFLIYLREEDAFKAHYAGTLVVTAVLGVGIGVGWALTTNAIYTRTYDDVIGAPTTPVGELVNEVAIPIATLLLMLVPVIAVRLWRPGVRESLDGFVIGSLGALFFTAAATFTQAAPEFATGLVAESRPMEGLLALVAVRGVAAPLTAAALGGMVGAALWFMPRADSEHMRHWYSPTSVVPAVGVAALAYVGQGLIDNAWISYAEIVVLYAVIAVSALLALRIVLHCALLCEAPEESHPNEPVLCPECDHVVPELTFCANCGVAANAASRSSRRARRTERPIPIDAAPEGR